MRGYVETLETIECGDDYELKFAISFAIKTLNSGIWSIGSKGRVEMNKRRKQGHTNEEQKSCVAM